MKQRKRLGLREVRDLSADSEIWDSAVSGFGARRQKSEAVAYVLLYRSAEGRQRRLTIGRHGSPWTPDTARIEARRLLGEVAAGRDPAADKASRRQVTTVNELCDRYLADADAGRLLTRRGAPKRESTLVSDRGRIARHIRPLLGRLPVAAVTREDVEGFMHAVAAGETAATTKTGKRRGLSVVRGGRGVATRTVGLLGAIFTYAERKRLRIDNPVRGVTRFADQRRERRLSDPEYAALGRTLDAASATTIWPAAITLTRFLLLTGWRSGEAAGLLWSEIDMARRTATLTSTKTGRSVRPLSDPACSILAATPRLGELVFPASRGPGRMAYTKMWKRLAKAGDLPAGVSPHTLRHSFASLAGDLGYAETTIAALIGHQGRTMTSRYIHAADAVLLAAADAVAAEIEKRLRAE